MLRREVLRIVLALAVFATGVVLAVAVVAVGGHATPGSLAAAGALLVAAMLGFSLLDQHGLQVRAIRATLGLASVLSFYLASGLPRDPHGAEFLSLVVLVAGGLASMLGVVFARRLPRVAAAIAVTLGLYVAGIGFRLGLGLVRAPVEWSTASVAVVYAYVLAEALAAAWLVSAWFGVRGWRAAAGGASAV